MTTGSRENDGDDKAAVDQRRLNVSGTTADVGGLGRSTRRGARHSLAAQLFTQAGSVVATIILARLLTPGDFGIVAITQSLLGAASLLSLAGITAALVTRRDGVDAAAETYFVLAAAIGLLGVLVFSALARPLTELLGVPRAAPYLAALSISFALSLLTLVPNSLLQRNRRFGALNVSLAAASGAYFAVEIALAVLGFGAWSVVIGQIVGSAVGLGISFRASRFRPAPRFSLSTIKSDLRMTTSLGMGQLFAYVQKNADNWAVASFLGAHSLGLYYIAYVLPNIVRLRLTAVMRQVLLPAYARTTPAASAALWVRSFSTVLGIGLPVLTGIACVADLLVAVFFGRQWSGAVGPMRILTIATVADLVSMSVGTVAIAHDMVQRYLGLQVFRAAVTTVLAFAAAAMWSSVDAVAWAVAISAGATLLLQEVVLSRPLGVGVRTVAGPAAAFACMSLAMAAGVTTASQLLSDALPPVVQLLCLTLTGMAIYLALGYTLARSMTQRVVGDAIALLKGQ